MTWLIFALLTALCNALKDVFSKMSLKNIDVYIVSASLSFFSVLFLAPALLFSPLPMIGDQFYTALITGGILNVVAVILYMKAIHASDLSLTIPIITFTPLFLVITSPIIVHEYPSLVSIVGIFLIAIGSYVLNIKESHKGFFAPIKAIFTERGPKLMLCVAIIYSISSNIDKMGLKNSSPLFWIVSVHSAILCLMIPIILIKARGHIKSIHISFLKLIPVGVCNSLTAIFQMTALKMTLVAYVISIKRMSALFCVFFGYFIFKEKGIRERGLGAVIMICGVLLITLAK